jgi:hypothetical protein
MKIFNLLLLFALCGCATQNTHDAADAAPSDSPESLAVTKEITKTIYERGIASNAVVVFDVNWGRKWGCGGFENAELMRLEFDRLNGESRTDEAKADLIVKGPFRLTRNLRFINYAFLVPPGEYGLSGVSIKVARSVQDVGYLDAKRSNLMKEGKPEGGSFTVAAGEIVYVGNFFLDCQTGPMLWRYYTPERKNFVKHIGEFRAKYPFLEAARFKYRLFHSTHFGNDYELPQ